MVGSITKQKPDIERSRGRPRQRWTYGVQEDLNLLNIRTAEGRANYTEGPIQYVVA